MPIELPPIIIVAFVIMIIAAITATVYMVVDAMIGFKYYKQFRENMTLQQKEESEEETEEEQSEITDGGGI